MDLLTLPLRLPFLPLTGVVRLAEKVPASLYVSNAAAPHLRRAHEARQSSAQGQTPSINRRQETRNSS